MSLVKSTKNNGRNKPVLKKLSTRLDKYDASVDLENQIVIVKLRNKVFKIRLLHCREYVRKFLRHKWYEVIVSINRSGRLWICILFKWEYRPYKPRSIISLDINLKKIVIYNGRCIRRVNTRFMEALYLKHLAEKV